MLNVMAASNVSGPNLPISIVIIIMILPAVVKDGVMPQERPTVPSAEDTSNIISIN
jgi:hypothetical protein